MERGWWVEGGGEMVMVSGRGFKRTVIGQT